MIVVGAGLSGLACADLLHEAGLKIIVLEAAEQIGGRICSFAEQGSGHFRADLGPTWIWPKYQPAIAPWLQRLDIEIFDQYEMGDAILDLQADGPVQRQYIPVQDGIARISGGPLSLIDKLSSRLEAGVIKTAHNVTKIECSKMALKLTAISKNQNKHISLRARRVVISAPLRIARQRIDWSGELSSDVLQEMNDTPTWMATQAKAVALYAQPFWRKAGLSGRVASQAGPLTEIHDHCSADGSGAALFGFIGWPHQMRKSTEHKLKGLITDQLMRCYGAQAGRYSVLHIKDWATSETICSHQDLTSLPAHPEIISDRLRNPHFDGRLFFCTSETSTQSPGLIEGAFTAAQSTATRLIAEF